MDNTLKKYRFDYIREEVMEKWSSDTRKRCTLMMIQSIGSLSLPWFVPGEIYIPAHDIYGDPVEDINDWVAQKDKYCEELYNEICAQRSWVDNLDVWWDRSLLNLDITLSFGFRATLINIWLWIKNKFSNHENDGKF